MLTNINDWNQKREKIKNLSSELTDEDLHYEKGKEEELVTRLQTKLGLTKVGIRKFIRAA